MKKKDRIFWAVYIVAGMVMMAVGLKLDIEYYSTLLFAIGFSFMTNGLAWSVTVILCFVGAFVMSLFQKYTALVAVLFGLAVLEYVAATVIYKHLCRKM